ncbi:MAG: dienelactone hydrolase family protein [bacterium]|nr:dienelactone hydrolase family protein [bacterium]
MTARIRSIDYDHDGHPLRGELAWDDAWTEPRPCVVVVHDAMKSNQGFEEERAVTLSGLGYAGFALDVYGADVKGTDDQEAYQLMEPFQADRRHLQARLRAGLEAAAALPEVDATRMAAIGYCFGGMCVLDLARMNADLAGVASFHGLLAAPALPDGSEALAGPIEPKVLVLHGWDDPYVPPEAIPDFAAEMSARDADWQLVAYGNTVHAFTNARYQEPGGAALYSPSADRRSWQTLTDFLAELFPS